MTYDDTHVRGPDDGDDRVVLLLADSMDEIAAKLHGAKQDPAEVSRLLDSSGPRPGPQFGLVTQTEQTRIPKMRASIASDRGIRLFHLKTHADPGGSNGNPFLA